VEDRIDAKKAIKNLTIVTALSIMNVLIMIGLVVDGAPVVYILAPQKEGVYQQTKLVVHINKSNKKKKNLVNYSKLILKNGY